MFLYVSDGISPILVLLNLKRLESVFVKPAFQCDGGGMWEE